MDTEKRNTKKEAFWRDFIRRQANSGLSVRQFCRKHALSEPSFYERRRTFQKRDAQQSLRPPAFIPVTLRAEKRPERDAGIVIELRGGRLMRLPGSMANEMVATLARALEATETST